MISANKPDWDREKSDSLWNPGKNLLSSIRQYQSLMDKGGVINFFLKKTAVLRHHFWSAISGADIPLNSKIAGGLLITHPNGIVIHPKSTIGPNCLFFQQVTIGERKGGVPVIGGHVDIGAGAKVLGDIRIGDHVCIGANSVVLKSIPDGCTAVGVPAKVIKIKEGLNGSC